MDAFSGGGVVFGDQAIDCFRVVNFAQRPQRAAAVGAADGIDTGVHRAHIDQRFHGDVRQDDRRVRRRVWSLARLRTRAAGGDGGFCFADDELDFAFCLRGVRDPDVRFEGGRAFRDVEYDGRDRMGAEAVGLRFPVTGGERFAGGADTEADLAPFALGGFPFQGGEFHLFARSVDEHRVEPGRVILAATVSGIADDEVDLLPAGDIDFDRIGLVTLEGLRLERRCCGGSLSRFIFAGRIGEGEQVARCGLVTKSAEGDGGGDLHARVLVL